MENSISPSSPDTTSSSEEVPQVTSSLDSSPAAEDEVPELFVPVTLPQRVEESQATIDAEAPTAPLADEPAAAEPTTEDAEKPTVKIESSPPAQPAPAGPTVEFVPPPEATYQASLTLELRCELPEASIHYALDTQEVDESSPLYRATEKIFLTQSTTVAARVFVAGQGGPVAVGRFEIAKPGWQKLEPTEQSDPTPHEQHEEATLEGPWRLAAASVRGKLHAHRGAWREDAFRHGLAHAGDGTYSIIVVSDGAGSAQLSRVGSNLICQSALDFLCAALTDNSPLSAESKILIERDLPALRTLLVEAARNALQHLTEEATTRTRPLSDFASTLLILVRREWNGQQLCAALQSGDGGIALWNEDGSLTLLGEADHGEHSSETRFLTSHGMAAELPARVKFSIRPNLRALAVMTDGVADDFFPEASRFPELFQTLLPLVEGHTTSAGAALLDWIDYEKKGSSDDRTLVLCWRQNSSMSPSAPSTQEASNSF